jgi:hypothetical protein
MQSEIIQLSPQFTGDGYYKKLSTQNGVALFGVTYTTRLITCTWGIRIFQLVQSNNAFQHLNY